MQKAIVIFGLFLCLGCSNINTNNNEGGGGYSPLWKYRNFPMQKVTNYDWRDFGGSPMESALGMYIHFLQEYDVCNGIVSNKDYVGFSSSNNITHYYNGMENILCTFDLITNTNILFLGANERYIVYLSNSIIIAIDTNNTFIYSNKILVFDSEEYIPSIKVVMGNGNSPLMTYQILTNLMPQYIDSHYKAFLVNLETKNIKTIGNVLDIMGFSRNNKYLFYNNYFLLQGFSLRLWNQGQFSLRNIENETSIVVGDVNYEKENFNGTWSDGIVGFTEDLEKFYVLQARTDWYAISGPLIDGRYPDEVAGLWEIDISKLGLTE
jgi:hypothetical protein